MEDEDGYTRIDPRKLGIYTVPAPPKAKAPPPNLWWKIAFGISLAGNIALALTLIILNLPVFQDGFSKLPQNPIPSCLQNCVPCHSAKDSEIANLTLDPNTAFAHLYVSSDLKSVKWKGMKQNINSSPMRYDVMSSVLSYQGFNSKKICWEVEVVGVGTWWAVGIVRESANRNGPIFLAPEGGYWGVQLIKGQYEAITHPNRTKLSVCHPPKRVRVSLDYSEGLIAFFDGDTGAELFTFPKASFSGEKVHAWFLIDGWNGELTVHP